MKKHAVAPVLVLSTVAACLSITPMGCSSAPEGLHPAEPARTTVKMDFFHRPLPELALPNDIATRYDATSPTLRRINASMVAPTSFEARIRERLDQMDGWGVLMPVVVPFTGPINIQSVIERHDDVDYDTRDDAVYVINITKDSENYGQIQHLDFGNGNYPIVLERREIYWKNDPRGQSLALMYEEAREDKNGNGRLDPGEDVNGNGKLDAGEDVDGDGELDPPEDTDADGLLDVPNYRPGHNPAEDDLAGRADALMSFYEKETNTLIGRPLVPFEDETTYAVVVTRRILDAGGQPVGSPYPYINHTAQTLALEPLLDVLPDGLGLDDIAFTYSFTTQTIRRNWIAVRDGLYGHGVQKHIGESFPPEVTELMPLRDASHFPGMKKPHLMYGENWKEAYEEISKEFLNGEDNNELGSLLEGMNTIDYFVVGHFESPQLFPKYDADGNFLPLDAQVWPEDLSKKPAPTRSETVYFTAAIPRKEVSVRGEGKPAPIVFLGHGYTSNRFEVFAFSSYLNARGFAVIEIDGPSHGLGLNAGELAIAKGLLGERGLSAATSAVLADRAIDQNFDGIKDSGADFWTSYMFHTRDMVRQYALDNMQLIRIVRTFDGKTRWAHDTNGDGEPDLAGDFDGDGVLDISADSPAFYFGGSLGGIISMVMGGVEPHVDAIAPVAGGGGYADLGPRSTQSGVPEAFILRAMGPLFVGTIDPENGGRMLIETVLSDLNNEATIPLATVKGVKPWDTMVVENLRNGKRRCAFVDEEGLVRASNETDVGDPIVISFYRGPQILPSEDCQLREGAKPFYVLDEFQERTAFQDQFYQPGDPLVAMMEGLGLRRGHPDFRKLGGLSQMILESSDPAVLAQYWQKNPLHYPGTGETTGTHAMIITTMGDTSVPVSGGILVGRSAGIVPYLEEDPRYGVSINQHYIDTHTTEGMHNLMRYTSPDGEGVHLDVENFSQGTDFYGNDVPRTDEPIRAGWDVTDLIGGKSVHIVPYTRPDGQHGFDLPGGMTDRAIKRCIQACPLVPEDTPEEEIPKNACGCQDLETFDIGFYMLNMVAGYFQSEGTAISDDLCQSSNTCDDNKVIPEPRPADSLD